MAYEKIKENTGVIYKIENKINHKVYIGQAVNFQKRKSQHLNPTQKFAIHRAIDKYGEQNFNWSILEEDVPRELLNEREIYWVSYYDSFNNGYNETAGGDNADGFAKWRANHPDEAHEIALNGLKYANKYWEEHPEEKARCSFSNPELLEKALQKTRKRVRCIEKNLIFESITEAAKWTQSSDNDNGKTATNGAISRVCNGKGETSCSYHWEFVDNN